MAPPIVLPNTGVKADVFLHCLTILVMGGNGLSRSGGNLGFRVWGLGFRNPKNENPPNINPLLHWGKYGIIEGLHALDPLGGLGLAL